MGRGEGGGGLEEVCDLCVEQEVGLICVCVVCDGMVDVCMYSKERDAAAQPAADRSPTHRSVVGTKFSLLHQVDALAKPPSKVNDLYVGDHHRLFNIIKSNRFCAITIQLVVRILWSVKM